MGGGGGGGGGGGWSGHWGGVTIFLETSKRVVTAWSFLALLNQCKLCKYSPRLVRLQIFCSCSFILVLLFLVSLLCVSQFQPRASPGQTPGICCT